MKWLIGFWILAIGAGFYTLQKFGNTPGEAGMEVRDWPADSQIECDSSRANLVLAIHPHCPCSRATIDALAQVMTRCQGLVTGQVLFYRPADFPDGWERTGLWQNAEAIPGVTPVPDQDGQEAFRFGATTSGHVVLYSAKGKLLFAGGITVSRGHQGSNPGMESLISIISQGDVAHARWHVFGCPLQHSTGVQ